MKTLKFKVIKNIELKLNGETETIFKDQVLLFLMDDFSYIHLIFNNGKNLITKYMADNVAQDLIIQLVRNQQIKKHWDEDNLLDLVLGLSYGK